MTTTNWRKAATGDFAKKGKWDNGVPGVHTDAVIAATGANYVVKVISADAAHSLTLDSINATLLEKVHGSLNVGILDIEAGTAVLTTANTIGSIALAHNGELEFSSSAALGAATLSIAGFAVLAATANAGISNDITLPAGQASFAVKHGAILKLDGGLTFNTQVATTLNFMGTGAHGAGDGTGVVDVDGTIGAMSAQKYNFLNVTGVTLGTSIADNSGFDTFLSNFHVVKIGSNGGLDLTGQNNVTLTNPQGTGELLNSGPHENLTLVDSSFGGTTNGDFDLTVEGDGLGGTIALKAGDAIHVIDGANFVETHFIGDTPAIDMADAGTFSGGTLSFKDATFSGTGPAVDLGTVSNASSSFVGATFGGTGPAINFGTGQNDRLDIDLNFNGTVSNFGDGGTDHIGVDDAGAGISTLHYKPNEAGTGGDLVVKYENAVTFILHLDGTYTQGDFKVDPNNAGLIDCSAEQSSPHVPAHLVDALI